jgi:predicted ATPase
MQEEISFGIWLRKQRREMDLSRQAFAAQVGCAEVTLRRIEAGTLKPSKELARILLEMLDIPKSEWEPWLSFARGTGRLPTEQVDDHSNRPVTNLPASLTSFIGREKEQTDAIWLLGKHRLVTFTGSGGVGKSRLSIKVGEQVLENYADGVWFVELAFLSDPALLAQTVTALLGIAVQPDLPYVELLINSLRPKSLLLILDNCEHLVEGCAHFTEVLLKSCPGLKILATSREPIGVLGEALYRVPSLGLPGSQELLALDSLRDFEAVKLFEERALLAQFDFSLTSENVSAIAQICQRLDGIPLAIELAAAKVGVLSIEQIAQQLEESFNLLNDGSRTVLPRHHTLRASMDWSWGLLTESEQALMRQLSMFAGGWTLNAAQAVCDGDVLELTNSLVKKSLVGVDREVGHDLRYRFHEIVRQYAHEKFAETGEEEKIRTRHMKYFLLLVEQAEPELRGRTQMQWYARLKDERENLRAALSWADQTDLEAGLSLSSSSGLSWSIFGLHEGNYWLTNFLQKPESRKFPERRSRALYVQASVLHDLQQMVAASSAATECLDLCRSLGNKELEIDVLLLLSWDPGLGAAQRFEFSQRAHELAQLLGDVSRQVETLWNLGYPNQDGNRFLYKEKAIKLVRSLGNVRLLADYLSAMALDLFSHNQIDTAQKYLDEATALSQEYSMNPPPRDLLLAHGNKALIQQDYENARIYFLKSMATSVEHGNPHDYFSARLRLGYVDLHEGHLDESRHIFSETVEDFQRDNNISGVIFALEGLAGIFMKTNKIDKAVALAGWTDANRTTIGEFRLRLEQVYMDQITATCLTRIGEAAYKKAYSEGEKMTFDQAISYALAR